MIEKSILILAALGLFPIALSYGLAPSVTIPFLLGFPVETVELTHVFRAIMGLYIAILVFWISGALNSSLRKPALWSLFIFMAGLAAGRLVSMVFDGFPGPVLTFYLAAEILFAALALYQIRRPA